jgi:hypothetical protein
MAREYELKLNIRDAAIWAAIRYLDPDSKRIPDEASGSVLVIYVSLTVLALGCLGFIWLCHRVT